MFLEATIYAVKSNLDASRQKINYEFELFNVNPCIEIMVYGVCRITPKCKTITFDKTISTLLNGNLLIPMRLIAGGASITQTCFVESRTDIRISAGWPDT